MEQVKTIKPLSFFGGEGEDLNLGHFSQVFQPKCEPCFCFPAKRERERERKKVSKKERKKERVREREREREREKERKKERVRERESKRERE
jgi:hypothetical protein